MSTTAFLKAMAAKGIKGEQSPQFDRLPPIDKLRYMAKSRARKLRAAAALWDRWSDTLSEDLTREHLNPMFTAIANGWSPQSYIFPKRDRSRTRVAQRRTARRNPQT